MTAKQHAPAALRNRDPIAEVLARELPGSGTVLEIAAGTGEHAVFFAERFPALQWQPTDKLLFTLDDAELEAQLERTRAQATQVKAQLEDAQRALSRGRELVGDGDGLGGLAGLAAGEGEVFVDHMLHLVHVAAHGVSALERGRQGQLQPQAGQGRPQVMAD